MHWGHSRLVLCSVLMGCNTWGWCGGFDRNTCTCRGQVEGTAWRLRIHCQGGFVEVSRVRLGDGAKVKSSDVDIPVGAILGAEPKPAA